MVLFSSPTLSPDLLGALIAFAVVASITPGPNNAMLMASGANFGFRATVPHMLGVAVGVLAVLLSTGFGLAGLFRAYPALHDWLTVAGAVYLLWLAWKIASSDKLGGTGAAAKGPMSFWGAVLFQWVNPKVWATNLSALTAYAPQQGYTSNVLLIGLVFFVVNLPCILVWTGFGMGLRHALARPGALRAFNLLMAVLLVASLAPALIHLAGR